jgi:hypothetical protein
MRIGGKYTPDKNRKISEVSPKKSLFPRSDLFIPLRAGKKTVDIHGAFHPVPEPIADKIIHSQESLGALYRPSSSSGLGSGSKSAVKPGNPLLTCCRSDYGCEPYRQNCDTRKVSGQPANGNGLNSTSQSFNVMNSYYGPPLLDVKISHFKSLGLQCASKINTDYDPRGTTRRERHALPSSLPASPATVGDGVLRLTVGSSLDEDTVEEDCVSPSGKRLGSTPSKALHSPFSRRSATPQKPTSPLSSPGSRPGSPGRPSSPKIAARPKSPLEKELSRKPMRGKSFVSDYVSIVDAETGEHHVMREPWSKPKSPLIHHLSAAQMVHHFAHSGGADDNHTE